MVKLAQIETKTSLIREWEKGKHYQEGTHVYYPDSDSVWRCGIDHVADNPPDTLSEHWAFLPSVGKSQRRAVLIPARKVQVDG